MDERQPAEDADILDDAQADVRCRLGRAVGDETRGCFRGVRDQAGGTAEQNDEHIDDRRMMAEHLDGEERAADRTDDGVDCIPCGIEPGHFIGEKFERVHDAGDGDDPRMTEHFEGLVARRERDPMQMNREAGDEDGEIKIDPREAGETESDGDGIKSIHARNICEPLVAAMTNDE